MSSGAATPKTPLRVIVRKWGRIGCIGFGGPPTHIALLRELVRPQARLEEEDFEDAIAACNLLPALPRRSWRSTAPGGCEVGRRLAGGRGVHRPGLVLIVALAALFLASSPPRWVLGAGAGAGAAVAAVALQAGWSLVPASWERAGTRAGRAGSLYLAAGGAAAATLGPWLVLVLLGCGAVELVVQRTVRPGAWRVLRSRSSRSAAVARAVCSSLAWVAFKVGALSYGGGFVIIPLMQADAVSHYHWMTGGQFLNAVALGQITPGPVVQTVAVVGYAAAGSAGRCWQPWSRSRRRSRSSCSAAAASIDPRRPASACVPRRCRGLQRSARSSALRSR